MTQILNIKAFILFWITNLILITSTSKIQKTYKIESIRKCRDQAHYAMTQKDFIFRITGGIIVMNSTFEVAETIEGPLKQIINIRRCDADFTGCGFFNALGQGDLCPVFNDPLFAPLFYVGGSAGFRCPVEKGTYHLNNTSFNVTPIIQMPSEGYRWYTKTSIVEVNRNRTVYCTEVHTRIIKFKSRKN